MKILLVTPDNMPDYFKRFLTTLRTDVGTCEHLNLSTTLPFKQQKKLFDEYLYSMSFDRHVLCYREAIGLHARLQLCAGLGELTLLSLQPEQPAHRKAIHSFALTTPWLRWTGSDEHSFRLYQHHGIDAHLLPPMVEAGSWESRRDGKRPVHCHVLGNCDARSAVRLPVKSDFYLFPLESTELLAYVKLHVKSGDIVVIQEKHCFERHLIAEIMANGALVVVSSRLMASDQLDATVRSACVSVDGSDELAALFEQIDSRTFAELLSRSLARAQIFAPEAVARVLGRLLAQSGRDRSSFQARPSWY